MKILSSQVQMTSTHDLYQEKQLNESMQLQTNGSNAVSGSQDDALANLFNINDTVNISEQAQLNKTCACQEEDEESLLSDADQAKLKLIKTLLEFLTGKEIRFSVLKLKKHRGDQLPAAATNNSASGQSRLNWGFRYDRVERFVESECSTFAAQAVIKTADGREINASLQVNMSRQFISQNEIHIRAGNAIDPLVINFDGPAAAFGETTFQFDLDADGDQEQLASLEPGSGFLALDKNQDGVINDGSELFGPGSGDGFAELAAYDEDGNGWIDESDSIYQNLRIWSQDKDGNQQLVAIGEKGIGAIYLGSLTSPFSIKNSENESLAEVRSSGFFLRENDGTMGSIQQLDLVV